MINKTTSVLILGILLLSLVGPSALAVLQLPSGTSFGGTNNEANSTELRTIDLPSNLKDIFTSLGQPKPVEENPDDQPSTDVVDPVDVTPVVNDPAPQTGDENPDDQEQPADENPQPEEDTRTEEEKEFDNLKEEFSNIEDDFNTAEDDLRDARRDDDERDIENAEDDLKDLQKDLKSLEKKVDNLEDDVNDLERSNLRTELKDDVDDLQTDIRDLKEDIDRLLGNNTSNVVSGNSVARTVTAPAQPKATLPDPATFDFSSFQMPAPAPQVEQSTSWEDIRLMAWIGAGIVILLAVVIFMIALLVR
ncbi:hypothetical protein COV20_05410 [Candidatus Woesearchaeota archaeon CG10_big_fil_rev_8_21_14_0_10_45_16]|nr:MAG: hypothetical protein COV20_05410 [Candidatus Woesearchaeota archaeon CG10_big_fil_rev_8_21_14_0_10_45_16]